MAGAYKTSNALEEVTRFLGVLFLPTDLLEVRVLPMRKQLWRNARDVPALVPDLAFHNEQGNQDIYVGANPRIREGGSEADVALARSVFADFDDVPPDEATARITAAKVPAPTVLLFSGHGTHAYWLLTSPLTDLSIFRAAQGVIATRLQTDPKVKDPPRVMRLPGFFNIPDEKKGETEPVLCEIVSLNAESRYDLAEVAGAITPEAPRPAPKTPANPADQMSRLSRSTLQFCFAGAAAGERNSRLFSAACDMAGCGMSIAQASDKLMTPALASGLSEAEARQTVESAYDKPRSPATPDPDDEIGSALQRQASPANGKPVGPALILPPPQRDARLKISNVVDTDGPEGEPVRYYVPLPQIASNIQEATGGWPKRAGGILFTVNNASAEPGLGRVRWIKKQEELFAWLGHTCDVRWSTSEAKHAVKKGTRLNPPTKLELFAYLKDGPVDNYRAVEVLPHHPPIYDLYYLPCELPKLPIPVDDTPTPLQELITRFNPETELDRKLMLAALVTPGWGGPPGARPAFVFTSDHGRGTGKTTTANVMAEVWGGAMTVGAREEFEQVKKRLLGDDSLSLRVCLMDNVKGRLSGSDFESLITAKLIDGWKPYVGQASRPNLMTWYLTANSPSLSRDLADRSVVIKVGRQAHGSDFLRWAMDFIRQHRPMILAEVFDILGGQALCGIEPDARDRWGAWQDAILTRFEDGNDLARLAISRRADVDSDQEDAEEIAAAVLALVSEHYPDHEQRRVLITYQQLYNRLVREGVTDKNFGPRNVISWVKDRCASGPLHFLQPKKTNAKRGWLYTGSRVTTFCEIDEIADGAGGPGG